MVAFDHGELRISIHFQYLLGNMHGSAAKKEQLVDKEFSR
jgi:hypothetical protein